MSDWFRLREGSSKTFKEIDAGDLSVAEEITSCNDTLMQ
jgi:hypothetical protein